MLLVTHAVVGAAVGSATGNPYSAFLVGVVSHHVLDAIPHFDQGTFHTKRNKPNYMGIASEEVAIGFSFRDWAIFAIDVALASVIFSALISQRPDNMPAMLSGTLGGLVPDMIDSSPLWSKKLREKSSIIRTYHSFHHFFHWTASKQLAIIGILTQVVLIGMALKYLTIINL